MTVTASPPGADGTFCAPNVNSVPSKIAACLKLGMEAVLIPEAPDVVCATPKKGRDFLDRNEALTEKSKLYTHPHKIDWLKTCEERKDRRILEGDIIKVLIRQAGKEISPNGIRIIGAIFCSHLDLNGLDLPYSLVLDRSVVAGKDSQIDIRNFQTSGDLSLDNTVVYTSVRIRRSEISGSLYAERAFLNQLEIGDSVIKGSIKLDHSFIVQTANLENITIDGDLDISTSYFSTLEVLKAKIDGVLDLSRSQARCAYDVRKNSIGDMIAAQLGFGAADASEAGEATAPYSFKAVSDSHAFGRPAFLSNGERDIDPYDRFSNSSAAKGTQPFVRSNTRCQNDRNLRAGTFLLVDNDIKASLCIRSFNWFTHVADINRILKSNIYLNEDVIDGAAWLDFVRRNQTNDGSEQRLAGPSKPDVSIFNVKAGTLVLNFKFAAPQEATLNVNGLQFERIYASQADCEAALSIRSSRDLKLKSSGDNDASNTTSFPPKLQLPDTKQVIDWIDKNSFSGTQQPFAQFVTVFERAGDVDAARELKIEGETTTVMRSMCKNWGVYCERAKDELSSGQEDSMASDTVSTLHHRMEGRLVTLLQLSLWKLADHGYRPERVVWFIFVTLLAYWVVVQLVLGVVGFSVTQDTPSGSPRIHPISLIFLFDKLLPAYNLRERHSKQLQFYVLASDSSSNGYLFRRFFRVWDVTEADERQQRRVELLLDVLRWLGLVFAIFVVAAIGRLVR